MSELLSQGINPELEPEGHIDLSEKFREMRIDSRQWEAWDDLLYSDEVRKATSVKLVADLTGVEEGRYVGLAKNLKALIDRTPGKWDISIICTLAQKAWERNVFASGVKWIKAEES